jgi:peptidoglycan/xylan/chitin deacetylase (PgdA/CDA1 family)
MRKSTLLIIAGLLLLVAGCGSSAGSDLPVTHRASAASRLKAGAYDTGAAAAQPLAQRSPLPAWAVPYENKLVVGVITDRPAVALTIDDVGATDVKPLVDALVANHLHATLFCIGSTMTTEAAAYAETHGAAHGIELGNHSWLHKPISWYRPLAANEQIMRTARLIKAGTGKWPIWYRAPFQNYESQGMRAVANAGMLAAGVSNDPLDYHGVTGAALVSAISRNLKPGQIILTHHYPQTIATLPALSAEMRRRNVGVLNLSELAQTGKPATSTWQLQPFARFFGQ